MCVSWAIHSDRAVRRRDAGKGIAFFFARICATCYEPNTKIPWTAEHIGSRSVARKMISLKMTKKRKPPTWTIRRNHLTPNLGEINSCRCGVNSAEEAVELDGRDALFAAVRVLCAWKILWWDPLAHVMLTPGRAQLGVLLPEQNMSPLM